VEASEIEFIRRWQPIYRPLALSLPSRRLLTSEEALHSIELGTSLRARDAVAPRPLLALNRLPAGEYRVIAEGAGELAGTLRVSVGATSQTIEEWPLAGRHAGDVGLRVQLPTLVHSLTIRSDDRAGALISRLALRPDQVHFGGELDERYAVRAARYGATRVFFLDDGLFMEPAGIWTRGDSVAEIVLTTDLDGPSAVNVTAGPTPAVLDLEGTAGTDALNLQPGEQRVVRVAPGRWKLTTRGGFRPKDFDRENQDGRWLGVRLEFPR